jgi:hypothetical protein
MTRKWVQAENERDEKLDVYVLVDEPDEVGRTERLTDEPAAVLLGPDGRPWKRPRPMGFRPPWEP